MEVNNMRELAGYIRAQRKELGWSQAELAEKIGVGRFWVIDLEKGKSTAEVGVVLRAIKALGFSIQLQRKTESEKNFKVDLSVLLGESKEPQP